MVPILANLCYLVVDLVSYCGKHNPLNTLLKHVIERSIWRIVVGEGSWGGVGGSVKIGDWVFDLVGIFP